VQRQILEHCVRGEELRRLLAVVPREVGGQLACDVANYLEPWSAILQNAGGYTPEQARAAALQVLPDILHYDRTQPATYPNGRVPTDDVYSLRFAWLTNGKVPPSGLKPHDDLLAHFPYLGPPNP